MDTELDAAQTRGNDGAARKEGGADDPDGRVTRTCDATEGQVLLSGPISDCNGDVTPFVQAAEVLGNQGNAYPPAETSSMCWIKRKMNKKIKWWMVIVFIFLLVLIAVVIIISLVVCAAIHEDADEKFDPSLFQVPRCFNGSFQLPNVVFTEELSSNKSQALAGDLERKLAGLFGSSPALGRYFSKAEINAFRNGSVIADYQLTFLMPEDEQDQLRTFTLSREMVYNVFRQFLYDQDSDPPGLTYIDPVSLHML